MSKFGPFCFALRLMASLVSPITLGMGAIQQNQSPGAGIDYEALERERAARIQGEMQRRLRDEFQGRGDGLRRVILRSVVLGDYPRASDDLDGFVQLKSNYPEFGGRVETLVQHSKELINAIRAKRNLPGLSQLSMSKQKEIMDNVVAHFGELKITLKAIERVSTDVSLSDIRSTVVLIKTVSYVILGLAAAVFFKNFGSDIGKPFWVVFNDLVNLLFESVAGLF